MTSLLFINQGRPDKPAMAAACIESMAGNQVSARAAALFPDPADKRVMEIMRRAGLEWPETILSAETFRPFHYDLIIGFCDDRTHAYPALPGNPVLINWRIGGEPGKDTDPRKAEQAWWKILERIRGLVNDLLNQGYLDALVQARRNSELILDNLSEGIIAHDLNRRFFFFNRVAEEITGLSREEVLGRDCHAVFPERFCSSHCHYCEKMSVPLFPTAPYTLNVRTSDGEDKLVEMFVMPLKDNQHKPIGVVASMRDITREQELADRLGEINQFAGIVGRDSKMQEIYRTIRDVAESNVPVLVQGESGTGKELVASAIHHESARAQHRFVTINCGALPDTLLESELFGHVRGAFTGAVRDKKGRFELAHGGTLFLDEIGDISPAMQVKLLRVLQDGVFQRLGSEKETRVDVRIISATHKDLQEEIRAGRFRDDLYYRLCVMPITIPPLRRRRHDIALLADHLLKRTLAEEKKECKVTLTRETLKLLMEYDWPGNVRELHNIIRYLLVKCSGEQIEPHCLPPDFQKKIAHAVSVITARKSPEKKRGKLNEASVRRALEKTHGNKAQAARLLGVGRATLYRFLARQKS